MKYAKPRQYNHTSRYQIYRQIVDNNNDTYVETSNQTPVDMSQYDKYHEVTHREVNRLDMISNMYYGDPQFWWAIAMANNIIDPFVIPLGSVLRVPSLISLSNWEGALYGKV